jgi:hypothetical protein
MTPAALNLMSAARPVLRSTVIAAALACLSLTAACASVMGKATACDDLTYEKAGPTREQYLPCAGDVMATLDRLDAQISKMLGGEERARSEARASVSELRSLLKKAGGHEMLEWNDRALTSLNLEIWNTFSHHQACMMVAGQLFGRAPLGDETKREPARIECKAYRGAYQDASSRYRRLR